MLVSFTTLQVVSPIVILTWDLPSVYTGAIVIQLPRFQNGNYGPANWLPKTLDVYLYLEILPPC